MLDFSGKPCFSFDVDNAIMTQKRLRGNPCGKAKGKTAEVGDCQAIDLTSFLAVNIDKKGAFGKQILHFFFKKIDAVNPFGNGFLDVLPLNQASACFCSP